MPMISCLRSAVLVAPLRATVACVPSAVGCEAPELLLVYEVEDPAAAAETVEVIGNRARELRVPLEVVEQGDGLVDVGVCDGDDLSLVKDVIAGRTGRLSFQLVASDHPGDIARALEIGPPPDQQLLPTGDPLEPYLLVRRRLDAADTALGADGDLVRTLSGEQMSRASQGFDRSTGAPVVNFTFEPVGAEIFAKITTNHVRERFAVVLDGEIIAAPVIRGPIPTGSGQIAGGFTIEEAKDLAVLLNIGALPSPLVLIEERVGGAWSGEGALPMLRFAHVVDGRTAAADRILD